MKLIVAELEKEVEEGKSDKTGNYDAAGLLAGYYGLLVDHVIPLDEAFSTAVEVRLTRISLTLRCDLPKPLLASPLLCASPTFNFHFNFIVSSY